MFRIFKKEKKEKKKGTEKLEENRKTKKPLKNHTKKKKPSCRVNRQAQHRADASGAGIGPANRRSIGFAGGVSRVHPDPTGFRVFSWPLPGQNRPAERPRHVLTYFTRARILHPKTDEKPNKNTNTE
jgi:hypothetical protein